METTTMADEKWPEESELVEIADLILDDELFPRELVDTATVEEYAEAMESGSSAFPPVRVFRLPDTRLVPVDGWHRIGAAKRLRAQKMYAKIRPGSWADAVEAAAASNTRHGLKRTNADKRKAVQILLELPKWAEASNGEIARHCRVSDHLVADVRASFSRGSDNPLETLEPDSGDPPRFQEPELRRGADGKTYDVSRMGAAAERARQREPIEPPAERTWPKPEPVYSEPWGGPRIRDHWPAMRMPREIAYVDIVHWLVAASDIERLQVCEAAFAAISSDEIRLRHDAEVRKWLARHEKSERA
jgi:hypothetical protein